MLLERLGQFAHPPSVTSFAIDPRGRYLLTGGPFGARLWWAASGEPVRSMLAGARGRAVFAASGRFIVATGPTLWDVESGERVSSPDGTDEVLAIAPDGERVLTKNGGALALWAISGMEMLWSIGDRNDSSTWQDDEPDENSSTPITSDDEQELYRVHSAEFHANGERVLTAGFVSSSTAPAVVDRSAADGGVLQRFRVDSQVFSMALDRETSILLGGYPDPQGRMVRILSLATGTRDPRSAGPVRDTRSAYALAVVAVPGSTLAVVADRDGEMSVLDLKEGGGRVLSTRAHDGWISALAFLPDGRLVSAGGYDGIVRLWRLTVP